jgi:cbb3-type cytochrome oxidase maturation protein
MRARVDVLIYLIPAALGLGLIGLAAFLWALKSGQFDDLDGAAHRILFDDDGPLPPDRGSRDRRAPPSGSDDDAPPSAPSLTPRPPDGR